MLSTDNARTAGRAIAKGRKAVIFFHAVNRFMLCFCYARDVCVGLG